MLDYTSALADYRKVVDYKRESGGAAYGQALSEEGYALVLAGQRRKGLALMEEGVQLMRRERPSGFLVRAIRKLAIGYAARGRFLVALDLAKEAYDVATSTGALRPNPNTRTASTPN